MDLKDFTLGVAVALGLALVVFSSLARGRIEWASARLNVLVGAYLGWSLVGVAYSHYRFATISEWARLAAHVGLFWLVILSVQDMRQVRRIVGAAALAAIPMCVYAFLQSAGRDPVKWQISTARVFSFLGNATYLAGYLVLLLPLVVVVAWPRRESDGSAAPNGLAWTRFALSVAIAAMMVVALFLTVTLSPIIGFVLGAALGVALMLVRSRGRALRIAIPAAVAAAAVFVVCGYLLYLRMPPGQQKRVVQVIHLQDPSSKERTIIQRTGLEIFRTQPVVGKAYGTYGIYALERMAPSWYGELGHSSKMMFVPNYAHNELIEVLAEMGLVGAALFLAIIAAAYVAAFRVALRHPQPAWTALGIAIIVGMTAFLFQNLFGVTFRQTGTVTIFWLSLGLLAVAESRLKSPSEDAPGKVREYVARLSTPALAAAGVAMAATVVVIAWLAYRPVESNVLTKQAEREARAGRLQTAAMLADQGLALNPYSTVGNYLSAYAWGSLGDHKKSLAANERALALLPGNASVYYNIGVNYKELGRLEEARESIQRAIDLMPTAMRHHAAMAEVLLQMGKYKDALPYAQEAVRLEPRNVDAHLLVADVQSRLGNLAGTAAEMAEALRIAPTNVATLRQLATIYFRLGNYAAASDACYRWLRVEPDAVPAYVLLGASLYNQRKFTPASAALRKVVELDPSNLDARLRLGYSEVQLGRLKEANQQFQWLATNRPETPQGQKALALLESARRATSAARGAPR